MLGNGAVAIQTFSTVVINLRPGRVCIWRHCVWPATQPVACFFTRHISTQVPDYYDIIKKPIALNTIREKVNNCEYQTAGEPRVDHCGQNACFCAECEHVTLISLHLVSAGEYVSDVELMFSNCLQYNPRHTNEAKAGHRLQRFFHAELSRLGLLEHGSALPTKRSRHWSRRTPVTVTAVQGLERGDRCRSCSCFVPEGLKRCQNILATSVLR